MDTSSGVALDVEFAHRLLDSACSSIDYTAPALNPVRLRVLTLNCIVLRLLGAWIRFPPCVPATLFVFGALYQCYGVALVCWVDYEF